jgi:peptidoglycan lytic transglycosylase
MKKIVMGCAVAAMVALSARSEARPSDSKAFAKYVASESSAPVGEIGLASWYGESCQGNTTASGELFDMNELTAANRVLPIGTKIKVTNLKNHRSLELRVNDRGPFIPGRFLDVSKSAAQRLGFVHSGLALVQMDVVRYPLWYLRSRALGSVSVPESNSD